VVCIVICLEDTIEEYKDWLDQQPKDMISVMAMNTFIRRFRLTKVNASKEASLFIGHNYNEKTIWFSSHILPHLYSKNIQESHWS